MWAWNTFILMNWMRSLSFGYALLTGFVSFLVCLPAPPLFTHLLIRATGVRTSYCFFSVSYDCSYCSVHHTLQTQLASVFFYYGHLVLITLLFIIGYWLSRRHISYKPVRTSIAVALLLSPIFTCLLFLAHIPTDAERVLWGLVHSPSYLMQWIASSVFAVLAAIRLLHLARRHRLRIFLSTIIFLACLAGWNLVLPQLGSWLVRAGYIHL